MQNIFTKKDSLLIKLILTLSFFTLTACQNEEQGSQVPSSNPSIEQPTSTDDLPSKDLGVTVEDFNSLNKSLDDLENLSEEVEDLIADKIDIDDLDDLKETLEDKIDENFGQIGDIEDKIDEAVQKIKDKIEGYDENHPDVKKIKDRIAEIEDRIDNIDDHLSEVKNKLADKLDRVVNKIDDLISNLDSDNLLENLIIKKLKKLKSKVQDYQEKLRD